MVASSSRAAPSDRPDSTRRLWCSVGCLASQPTLRLLLGHARPALDEEALVGFEDDLVVLVEDEQLAADDAAVGPRGLALLRHADLRPHGVADPDRLREAQLVEAEEGDQRVVVEVELEQQAGGEQVGQRAVSDARAELRRLRILL